MPQFPFSTSIPAGSAGNNPLSGWQYEYLPWPAACALFTRSPVATQRLTIFSGSECIQEESPIQSGGTAGVTPSPLNTVPVTWRAPAGDRLKLNIRSTDAGAQTVDGLIIVKPLRR